MIRIISTNIISPIGMTTEQNYLAVKSGVSALKTIHDWKCIPGQLTAGIFSDEQAAQIAVEGCTAFQSLAIRSISEALSHVSIDVASPRTLLIISTTKADADELGVDATHDGAYLSPGESAAKIAARLGFSSEPVVVCNACISGVTAQIIAERLLESGSYDTAVVCGADRMIPFTVAGFTSFKALSPEECRPFDIERLGLNLGEAAATLIMQRDCGDGDGSWKILSRALNNDAYHVSAPSPAGEGVLRALEKTLLGADRNGIATITAHGTATMFNDQMESKAIAAAGMGSVPVSAYKGYFGHTLGAAGLLESIISMRAMEDGVILPVRGYEEIGVSGRINVSDRLQSSEGRNFVKIISGFGGCNGAILYGREAESTNEQKASVATCTHTLKISTDAYSIDGRETRLEESGKAALSAIYKRELNDNPKFYKMDTFSRLSYLAAGLLLKTAGIENAGESLSLIYFNKSTSVVADRQHIQAFAGSDGFFPSPSSFLYTLPNVVMGEISVKYGIKGETSFIILPHKDEKRMEEIISSSIAQSDAQSILTGWVECSDDDCFEADVRLVTIQHE